MSRKGKRRTDQQVYRALASAVIMRAWIDTVSQSRDIRTDAKRFLLGSPMLRWWCDVGALNSNLITDRARQRFARPDRRIPRFINASTLRVVGAVEPSHAGVGSNVSDQS